VSSASSHYWTPLCHSRPEMAPRRLQFESRARYPRLAWCARIASNEPNVHVVHGPSVELSSDAFVEGAWDAPFSEFGFDRSAAFQGTGGRIREGRLVFCSPTPPVDRLYAVRLPTAGRPDQLLVSNSLACLLAESDDGPDFAYPDYFFRILDHFRQGVSPGTVALPTARGREVRLFAVSNFVVQPDLSITPEPKDPGPEPGDYSEYESILDSAVRQTVRNAADAARGVRYEPVAMVSKGYDSVASASLAARAGCRTAVTYATSGRRGRWVDDDGGAVASRLGMETETYRREDWHKLPVELQVEHFMSPAAFGDRTLAVIAHRLPGSLLFTGRHGERVWGKSPACALPELREPDAMWLTGVSAFEQRLRFGWLEFHAPYIGSLQSPALHRITVSDEMRPWTVGGLYDRPVARRLAEEAGVPRDHFGVHKAGSVTNELRVPSPEARAAFELFLHQNVSPKVLANLRPETTPLHRRIAGFTGKLRSRFAHQPTWSRLFELAGLDRLHQLHRSRDLYQFHWGLQHCIDRIREASSDSAAAKPLS